MSCDLCLQTTKLALTSYGELQLCPSCTAGNLSVSLRPVGIALSARLLAVDARESAFRIYVEASMSGLHGEKASFSRLGLATKLINPFSPRAKTGDDIFDSHVRGRGRRMPWVRRLLESDAVRSACIEVTSQEKSSLKIEGNTINAVATAQFLGATELGEMSRAVALVLREMAVIEERWPSKSEGLPSGRSAYRAN